MTLKFGLFVLITVTLIINLFQLLTTKDELKFIAKHLNYNYSQKIERQFGGDYKFVSFIQENTPKDCVIAIPPRGAPWWNFGSPTVINYFLWPRELIEGSKTNTKFPNEATHALIVWFSNEATPSANQDWPVVDLRKYKVKMFQQTNPKLGIIYLK